MDHTTCKGISLGFLHSLPLELELELVFQFIRKLLDFLGLKFIPADDAILFRVFGFHLAYIRTAGVLSLEVAGHNGWRMQSQHNRLSNKGESPKVLLKLRQKQNNSSQNV